MNGVSTEYVYNETMDVIFVYLGRLVVLFQNFQNKFGDMSEFIDTLEIENKKSEFY
jgi:hypothetical protein